MLLRGTTPVQRLEAMRNARGGRTSRKDYIRMGFPNMAVINLVF
jgi:hypothetical protein